ncbi:MAG: MBL fold metallo-hydrolase [Opitutales bacterium]|nr:MBL fold metallo-hydrolase [Opitutales bacterium]MCH8540321.1 MBL fold metallo-hydrolase [Opitutales bacterium]
MEIISYSLGPLETNAFFLVGEEEFFVVDAPEGCWEKVKQFSEDTGKRCEGLLLTHGHWDHIADLPCFNEAKLSIWAHKGDRDLIENPGLMSSFLPFPVDLVPGKVDQWVEDGEKLDLSIGEAKVLHVPGHAPGNIAFWFSDEQVVFGGDALFSGSIGRYDLPNGDGALLSRSIQDKLFSLPDVTVVYPGHGPETTVGREKLQNPFFQ